MKNFLLFIVSILILSSCHHKDTSEISSLDTLLSVPKRGPQIDLVALDSIPTFGNDSLIIKEPLDNAIILKAHPKFVYEVHGENFKMYERTKDSLYKTLENSKDGQHIHLIINNKPFEPVFKKDYRVRDSLAPGNYVALSVLSTSYNAMVKSPNAYKISQFQIGNGSYEKVDLKEGEHLFLNSPRTTHSLSNSKNILLDFYLINSTLSETGNYIKLVIDKKEFKITAWKAYLIKGLKEGQHKISLELFNKDNYPIQGPFNKIERIVTVTK